MDKRKTVLFVCVENSCRSQMAEGLTRFLADDVFRVFSAGSRPSGTVNPDGVLVMRELGIDISQQHSKGFQDLPVKKFDFVITLGCGDKCPFVPAENHIDWKIEDPKGHDLNFFRIVRDTIQENIKGLIEEVKTSKTRKGSNGKTF